MIEVSSKDELNEIMRPAPRARAFDWGMSIAVPDDYWNNHTLKEIVDFINNVSAGQLEKMPETVKIVIKEANNDGG